MHPSDGGLLPESGESEQQKRAVRALGSVLLERFELLALLGSGSFGEVYQARDRLNPSSALAIKVLRHPSAQGLYRFKREFRALGELSHPNLVALHELFLPEGDAFFTMELVNGVDFLSYVRPAGLLDAERLRRALRGLCGGVAALHARGRLHRDLKPSNVLVDASGRAVIVDFGLSTFFERSAAGGSELGFFGTAHYAAPEQLAMGQVGPACDWYAVGTMLYEALSGALPYEAPIASLAEAKSRPAPALPALQEELRPLGALCMRMLQADALVRPRPAELSALLGQERPAGLERELRFVGRAPELEALEQLFAEVERGAAVVVSVVAPSGLGKSALAEHFLSRLEARHRAIVLRGRCYVNEEVAYRAVDGGIDALSHYLRSLPRAQAGALLPRDARSLACLFPVLNRVEAVASAPAMRATCEDRSSLRERGAVALRELVARLSDRLPVVLFIDDIQWDDEDSAWLLSVLLADPDPPALMLIATCRSDGRAHSHLLRALGRGQTARRLVRELALPALRPEETGALAAQASAKAAADPALAAALAAESGGHPLFALELARSVRPLPASAAADISLDAVIRDRAADLSPAARRLLEIVCVAGHPLKYADACGAAESEVDALRELLARKLVAASGSSPEASVQVYHDRLREALLAALPEVQVRELHARLASTLERAPAPRFDLIVEHYLAAEQPAQAARHALRAADEAARVLAFHRVPELLTLAATAAEPAQRAELYLRLGEAYALLGRTSDAARAYQDAAELELDAERRWELGSLAMWQALLSQDFALGFALLRELDRPFGRLRSVRPSVLRVALSALRALVWTFWGPPRLRAPAHGSADERRRMRLALRAGTGLLGEQAHQAVHFSMLAFQLAAKLGDPDVYAAFLSMFAAGKGMLVGRPAARDERVLTRARALLTENADPDLRMWVGINSVIYAISTGQGDRAYRELVPLLERTLSATPFGALLRFYLDKIQMSLLFWRGNIAQGRAFAARAIANAYDRSDTSFELGIRALAAFRWLAEDDAEAAWGEWSLVCERYPQHWVLGEATWGVVPALYAGRFDRARSALARSRRLLTRWDGYVALGRRLYLWAWAAVAAARLAAGENSRLLHWRFRAAVWLMAFRPLYGFEPFVPWLRSVQAFFDGAPEQGVAQLERARALFSEHAYFLFAACASHALAALHPSRERREQYAAEAREVFEREKLKCPEKWVRALLPGLPAVASAPRAPSPPAQNADERALRA